MLRRIPTSQFPFPHRAINHPYMRGHWSHRSMAGFMMGLFLFLTVGLGEAAHICPVHDPVLAGAVAASGSHDAGSHAAMDAHHEMGSQSQGDQHSGHDRAHCCCTGLACVTTAVNLPDRGPQLPAVAVVTPATPELPEYARTAAAPAYFIPFANGPPTVSERSA